MKADIASGLFAVLQADPKDSKKMMAAAGGGASLLIVFIISAVIYCINPKDFGAFSGVVMITIPAVAGLSMAYLGGQSAVEYKATAALQATQEIDKPVVIAPVLATPTNGGK
jgi:hypothetical protein